MKKVFSFLAVLALVCMASSSVFAAFTPSPIGTAKKAYVTFEAPTIEFEVKIFDWQSGVDFETGYTGQEANSISFSTDTVTLGTAAVSWSKAKTFAKIHSNLTSLPAGTQVFMYTDNTKSGYTGDYKALAYREETWDEVNYKMYGGLVKAGSNATYQAGDLQTLHMLCAKVSDANTSYKTALPDISNKATYSQGRRRLIDIADTVGGETFNHKTDTGTYTSWKEWIIGKSGVSNGGIWVAYSKNEYNVTDNWFSGTEDVIVFFGGEFSNVSGGATYGTENITFSTFTE